MTSLDRVPEPRTEIKLRPSSRFMCGGCGGIRREGYLSARVKLAGSYNHSLGWLLHLLPTTSAVLAIEYDPACPFAGALVRNAYGSSNNPGRRAPPLQSPGRASPEPPSGARVTLSLIDTRSIDLPVFHICWKAR